eukprot:4441850-Lingulodinium_polyedra.AAC.2
MDATHLALVSRCLGALRGCVFAQRRTVEEFSHLSPADPPCKLCIPIKDDRLDVDAFGGKAAHSAAEHEFRVPVPTLAEQRRQVFLKVQAHPKGAPLRVLVGADDQTPAIPCLGDPAGCFGRNP